MSVCGGDNCAGDPAHPRQYAPSACGQAWGWLLMRQPRNNQSDAVAHQMFPAAQTVLRSGVRPVQQVSSGCVMHRPPHTAAVNGGGGAAQQASS